MLQLSVITDDFRCNDCLGEKKYAFIVYEIHVSFSVSWMFQKWQSSCIEALRPQSAGASMELCVDCLYVMSNKFSICQFTSPSEL